jgi:hypothetical protein
MKVINARKHFVLKVFFLISLMLSMAPAHSERALALEEVFGSKSEWISLGEVIQQPLGNGLKRIPFGTDINTLKSMGFKCSPTPLVSGNNHKCIKKSKDMTFLGHQSEGIAFIHDDQPTDYAVIKIKLSYKRIIEALSSKYSASPFVSSYKHGKGLSQTVTNYYWVFSDRGVIQMEVDHNALFPRHLKFHPGGKKDSTSLFTLEPLKKLLPPLDLNDL